MATSGMSRLAPEAFRHAEAVRGVGLGVLRASRVLTGLLLGVLALAVQAAVGLAGWGGVALPGLAAAVLIGGALAAYAALAPGWFARASRAATAPIAARLLAVAVLGHVVGWALLLMVVRV